MRRRLRSWLLAFLVTGLALNMTEGTFASFTADTANAGTFATGSLVLSNQVESATTCLSTAGGTTDANANACDALYSLNARKPGQSANVDVTLINEGNIDGSSLQLSWATPPCTTADAASTIFHGAGDLCPQMRIYVQQYTSDANRSTNTRTGGTCWYGGGSATSCSFNAAKTLADLATHDDSAPIDLGPTVTGEQRFLRVYVQLPGTAGNDVQGRTVDVPLRWQLLQ
ncbi:MAG: hypothetical protein JF603_02030 [Acidobacteria bacterium]|nr:hypothetical protein [Acidobacteriota bacterium]